MRYLGIDYGAKRIGLALSDLGGQFAFPHETIPNDATTIDRLQQIVKREDVKGLVIGDTRAANGAANPITQETERFKESLRTLHVPVHSVSEAWSSVEAARFAPKSAEHNDASAAAIILQRFLDSQVRQ